MKHQNLRRQLHRRRALGVTMTLLSSVLPAAAGAQLFYSLDSTYDGPVAIDAAAGTATYLGPAGYTVQAAGGILLSMEHVAGQVYWTNATPTDNPLVLAHMSAPAVAFGGVVEYMEGGSTVQGKVGDMTWNGSSLLVSIGFGTHVLGPRPHNLAELSLTGELTNAVDFLPLGVYLDLLAVSPGGEIYALERSLEADQHGILYRLEIPASVTTVGTIAHLPGTIAVEFSGMTFDEDGNLWVMEEVGVSGNQKTYTLRRIDPSNAAVLESLDFVYTAISGSAGNLRDLAWRPEPPTQSISSSWGRVKGAYRAPHDR